MRFTIACSLVLALSAGCGGGETEQEETMTTTEQPTTGAEPGPVAEPDQGAQTDATQTATQPAPEPLPPMPENIEGPPRPWARMPAAQKRRWMTQHVVPTMGPLFTAYDATKFAQVDCTTCHGENPQARRFRMPNASLPVLPTPGSPEFDALRTQKARMFEFMGTRVVPAMAQTLGLQPYDPATQQGFGCFNCHTMAGAAGAQAAGGPGAGAQQGQGQEHGQGETRGQGAAAGGHPAPGH